MIPSVMGLTAMELSDEDDETINNKNSINNQDKRIIEPILDNNDI